MLRCARVDALKKATLIRVPLLDNAALYQLLGPSTYQRAPRAVPEQEYGQAHTGMLPSEAEMEQMSRMS
jgi:hypothetical protein